jgi:hypothetical protein
MPIPLGRLGKNGDLFDEFGEFDRAHASHPTPGQAISQLLRGGQSRSDVPGAPLTDSDRLSSRQLTRSVLHYMRPYRPDAAATETHRPPIPPRLTVSGVRQSADDRRTS